MSSQIATVEWFEAQNDIVLRSAGPLRVTSGFELLDVRVNYVVRKGVRGFRGFPGVFCAERWPPKKFVDLHEVDGLRVREGDQLGVTVFARPRAPGQHEFAGVRIRYDEAGVLREQMTESSTVTVVARDSISELPPDAPLPCPPDLPSQWLGDIDPGHHDDPGHEHSH